MTGHFPKSKLRILAGLLLLVILIRFAATNTGWVEQNYSNGIYPKLGYGLRMITGWLPFSVGDILYLAVIIWAIWKVIKIIIKIFKRQTSWNGFGNGFLKLLMIMASVYIIFNIFWGLNYNRKGIAYQLSLDTKNIDTADLKTIHLLLLQKVNESKLALERNNNVYPSNKELFERAINCYNNSSKEFPFLEYKISAVKSSMFGWFGNYFGFTGYYNPFTGEAQVNTSVPKFLLPYTTCHEMAHQLGYAKEDEANFVGYLVATSSADTLFRYSAYLDLFLYANNAVFRIDSTAAKAAATQLVPGIKSDIKEFREFLQRHRNPFEPMVRWAYGNYLRANRQPKGMRSYDEVVIDLIAFYKKYGKI